MIHFIMRETDDYEKLVPFLIENDLEFSEEDPVPTDLVKCWEVVAGREADAELLAALVLAKREGKFIIDGIAVKPMFRKFKIGKILMEKGIKEVLEQGGDSIYLVARAPGFFRKLGFVTIPREDAPNFFECLTCPQYGVDCHPEVMKLEL